MYVFVTYKIVWKGLCGVTKKLSIEEGRKANRWKFLSGWDRERVRQGSSNLRSLESARQGS